jgi:two-component system, response regulator
MEKRTILLVEDRPHDVRLTKRAFAKCNIGNEIAVARDGQEALDMLLGDEDAALPAVVLLDLKLPKIDGIEVLKRIRANERTQMLPVVILTSSKQQEDVAASYRNGANSYIRKPVDFQQFVEAAAQLGLYWLVLNEPPV